MTSLAIIIPVGPGHFGVAQQAVDSIQKAIECSQVFSRVEHFLVDDSKGYLGRSAARNKGIDKAIQDGFDWIYFLDADDILNQNALNAVQPYLHKYDAIWGLIAEFYHGQHSANIRQGQISPISDYVTLITSEPFYSLQMGFFARKTCFKTLRFAEDLDTGEDFDMYLRLWKQFRCIKTTSVFFANRRGLHSTGPRSADGKAWRNKVESLLINECISKRVTRKFFYFGENIELLITNPFDIIQRSHLRDVFFEERELFALKSLVVSGGTIIDAGANIGNHSIFFSKYFNADTIVPFECNSVAIEVFKTNIELNRCKNINIEYLGIGLSDTSSLGAVSRTNMNNLGATSYILAADGDISFNSIDNFNFVNVTLIKVDCEGMDLSVLKGAAETIKRCRPILFFECFNNQYCDAKALINSIEYKTLHEFLYVNSRNIIAIPK